MASIEELQAAVQTVSTGVTDLVAKAQADAAAAASVVVPDFQVEVDALNATAAAIQAYLNASQAA